MAVREVVHYPAEVLKKRSKPVGKFGKPLRSLVADMLDTLYEFDGVGLAAPQVGESQRIVVIDSRQGPGEQVVLVNPKISGKNGEELGEEGCLSLPDLFGYVSRATEVDVTAVDCDGDTIRLHATGFFARIIQHEIDHLNGVVFVDRLEVDERERKISEYDKLRDTAAAGGS
jgi:peptide deformylase